MRGKLKTIVLWTLGVVSDDLTETLSEQGVVNGSALWRLLETGVLLNVILSAFNLLPIPPLDGSRVVDGLMPDRLRAGWDRLATIGPLALGAVIVLPLLAGISVLAWPMEWAAARLDAVAAFSPHSGDAAIATRPG